MSVWITGLGLWTARHPGLEAWRDRVPVEPEARPRGVALPARDRRRATSLARMAADVLAEALPQADRGPADVDLLLASVGGELEHTLATLRLLGEDPPASSPLRFGVSVHNAALGQLAIPWGNTRFASALAARDDRIVATGLLEALGRVLSGTGDAAVVFADEVWPMEGGAAAAVAVVLSADPPASAQRWARLSAVTRGAGEVPESVEDAAWSDSPARGALWLAEAILQRRWGPVVVGAHGGEGWTATLEAP